MVPNGPTASQCLENYPTATCGHTDPKGDRVSAVWRRCGLCGSIRQNETLKTDCACTLLRAQDLQTRTYPFLEAQGVGRLSVPSSQKGLETNSIGHGAVSQDNMRLEHTSLELGLWRSQESRDLQSTLAKEPPKYGWKGGIGCFSKKIRIPVVKTSALSESYVLGSQQLASTCGNWWHAG